MIRIRGLIRRIICPKTYIWIDVTRIKETPKAILIAFDGREAWLPRAWIIKIKHNGGKSIKIKISDCHWARKFA